MGAGINAQTVATDVARYGARLAAEEAVRYAAQASGFDLDAYRGIAFAFRDASEAFSHVCRHAVLGHPATGKAASVWLHLFNAFEAGLFLYWVTSIDVVCVLQPALSIFNGRLHRVDGPAIEWPFGGAIHLRHGLVLPDMTKIHPEGEVLLARLARMDIVSPSIVKPTVMRSLTAIWRRSDCRRARLFGRKIRRPPTGMCLLPGRPEERHGKLPDPRAGTLRRGMQPCMRPKKASIETFRNKQCGESEALEQSPQAI